MRMEIELTMENPAGLSLWKEASTSFGELDLDLARLELEASLCEDLEQAKELVVNIMDSPNVGDRHAACRSLLAELGTRWDERFDATGQKGV